MSRRFYCSMLCRNRGRFRERNHYPEANSHPRCCNPDLKTVYESSISLPANRYKETLNRDKGFMIKCDLCGGSYPNQDCGTEVRGRDEPCLEEKLNLLGCLT